MRKVYSSAPLPFMGQKRRFIKKFKDVINDLPADTIFVDMFGGSGLLSHTVSRCRPNADYECDGYLEDLVVVHCDYRDLFSKFKDTPGAVFLIDPPYLSTDVGSYKCYWKLVDYLDVLKCLDSTNYIYFTSGKSQIVELCEWLRKNPNICNTFEGAKIHTQQNNVNWQAVFTDMMLVRTA